MPNNLTQMIVISVFTAAFLRLHTLCSHSHVLYIFYTVFPFNIYHKYFFVFSIYSLLA